MNRDISAHFKDIGEERRREKKREMKQERREERRVDTRHDKCAVQYCVVLTC
jgi:hypothetical protein